MMKRLAQMFLVLVLAVSMSQTAHARTCEEVTLPNQVTVDGTTLRLVGMGVREATALQVNVYVAGLYLENPTRNATQVIQSNQKKRLILHFVRDVDASDVRDAYRTSLAAALRNPALRERVNQLLGYMGAMREGNRMTYTYVPGTGVTVQIGTRVKGTIPGEDFARAFFSIWFGANPPNSGLKTGLLGGECG